MQNYRVYIWSLLILTCSMQAHIPLGHEEPLDAPIVVGIPRAFTKEHKKWTIFVYFAADNNLHAIPAITLNQMKQLGSNENLNIVAFLDIRVPGSEKVARRLYVENGRILQIGPDYYVDSGSEKTLVKHAKWAIDNFPSDHFALVLWNHGSGDLNPFQRSLETFNDDRVICSDDTHHTCLDDQKLMRGLQELVDHRHGKKFDLLWLDGCLMGISGSAWLSSHFADYMIGSEEVIYGAGANYKVVLEKLAHDAVAPREFVKHVIRSHGSTYGQQIKDYTLSAVDLNLYRVFHNNIDTLAKLLIKALDHQSGSTVKEAIRLARDRRYCVHFYEKSFIDLWNFYYNLYINVNKIELQIPEQTFDMIEALKKTLSKGLAALQECIVANATGGRFVNAGGLSIYFPERRVSGAYYQSFYSTEFAKNNSWSSFLQRYAQA